MNKIGERNHVGTAARRDVAGNVFAVQGVHTAGAVIAEQSACLLLDLLGLVIAHAVDDVGVVQLAHDEQLQAVTSGRGIVGKIRAIGG